MASRNSIKIYVRNSFYHVYNRGVEKRNIFVDNQDYSVFLSYLKEYLSPKNEEVLQEILAAQDSSQREKDKALKMLRLKNYSESIDLICYALVPNHFHLLIRQKENMLNHFMNSLGTRYGMYFNRKYKRSGVLFQDVYKAVRVESDEQLLHLSKYIHFNSLKTLKQTIENWQELPLPCSLPEYLGKRQTNWIKKDYILDYFSKVNPNNSYEGFLKMSLDPITIAPLALDLDLD